MQAAVWQLTAGGRSAAHDLCISAPTGSGKTLAYALPIVAALQGCAALPLCAKYINATFAGYLVSHSADETLVTGLAALHAFDVNCCWTIYCRPSAGSHAG